MLTILAITDGQSWAKALTIVGIGLAAYALILVVAMLLWTYHDARSRTANTAIQAGSVLLVAIFNLPGFLLYLALRPPEALVDKYGRELEAEAFMREIQKPESCPDCMRSVDSNFVACPYCRATLRTACADCDRSLRAHWTICPYCTAPRDAAPWPERARRASSVASRPVAAVAASSEADMAQAQPRRVPAGQSV